MSHPDRAHLRALNDRLRITLTGGLVSVTPGIMSLGDEIQLQVLQALARFDAFNESNDPYDEHDFGRFEVEGHVILFKIDAYDLTLRYASPNPADSSVTTRVLTLMLADEY